MNGACMTVKDLKVILEDLDDDMRVIIPSTNPFICDIIENGFKRIQTAGILLTPYEDKPALCLNASEDIDISSQVKNYDPSIICEKILF